MNPKAIELIRYLQDGMDNTKKQVEIEIDLGVYRTEIAKIIWTIIYLSGVIQKGIF
jgi:hypothetical protein